MGISFSAACGFPPLQARSRAVTCSLTVLPTPLPPERKKAPAMFARGTRHSQKQPDRVSSPTTATESTPMNRTPIAAASVLVLLWPVLLAAKPARPASTAYKVGLAYRTFTPEGPYNWRGAKTHGLTSVIWYPAVAASVEQA